MSTLQQIQAIIDYFFKSDVELRESQNGTSEVWAKEGGEGEPTKFAVLYGDEGLADIQLLDLKGDESVQVVRELPLLSAFDALIRKLEDYTEIGHIIGVYRGAGGLRTDVDVVAMYEDVDYDEDGEPFTVELPVIARFRWDGYQDTLSAR